MRIDFPLVKKNLKPQSQEKEMAAHILNKKADAKLSYVTSVFTDALGGECSVAGKRLLARRLQFKGRYNLRELDLQYEVQNRFFAVSYDLQYSAKVSVNGGENKNIGDDFFLSIVYDGIVSSKSVRFVSGAGSDFSVRQYLDGLNDPLILDRIKALDLVDFTISWNQENRVFKIGCRSIVGSAVWNLIPPVFYVIKPKQAECIMIVELFELVMDILKKPCIH